MYEFRKIKGFNNEVFKKRIDKFQEKINKFLIDAFYLKN